MEFLQNNSIYVVLVIALIIWFGLFVYIKNVDSKLTKLEKHLENKAKEENNET